MEGMSVFAYVLSRDIAYIKVQNRVKNNDASD